MRSVSVLMAACAAATFGLSAAKASPVTMDFEGLSLITPTSTTTNGTYGEDGMTMAPMPPGDHFDVVNTLAFPQYPASFGYVVGLHEGNRGGVVRFTYTPGNFDLLSLDIVSWFNLNGSDTDDDADLTIVGSNGATHTVEKGSPTGTIDFTGLMGFSDLAFLDLIFPDQTLVCAECTGVLIDNLVFQEASAEVPLPAALPLFAMALGAGGVLRHRRQRSA